MVIYIISSLRVMVGKANTAFSLCLSINVCELLDFRIIFHLICLRTSKVQVWGCDYTHLYACNYI
ncbi:hypothetical protein RchiOBHm_Chr2g0146861 [Rosa chinensis]|uniref:Uncharacterized protein n=1 Tax=Rosa chinensis TaxID=74649 RepID=A0A2P6RZ05_ROSCH|nr:hypothetical protein RchiOBHm_Chr2g0146861 [Rosa chinensis]